MPENARPGLRRHRGGGQLRRPRRRPPAPGRSAPPGSERGRHRADVRLRHPALGSRDPRRLGQRPAGPRPARDPHARPAPSATISPRCPFCTFDYRAFCEGLLAQCRVRFLRTSVSGIQDGAVVTGAGRFTAPVIVDCSGWRRALTGGAGRRARPASPLLRTRDPYPLPGRGPDLPAGPPPHPAGARLDLPGRCTAAWSVSALTSADPSSSPAPRALTARLTASSAGSYHGTYFPNRLRRPTVGRVFAVGDAAGQCLPLTAEGIRPALYFGGECGRIVQQVLDGALSLEAGLEAYRRLVARYAGPTACSSSPRRWPPTPRRAGSRGHRSRGDAAIPPRWWPRYGWFGRPPGRACPGWPGARRDGGPWAG